MNRIYLRGTVSKELLTSNQFVHLSKKIKKTMRLQQKEKQGNEQSYKVMAQCSEYQQRIYYRGEVLTISNIILVISIAYKLIRWGWSWLTRFSLLQVLMHFCLENEITLIKGYQGAYKFPYFFMFVLHSDTKLLFIYVDCKCSLLIC
ncbi:hypothetical protein QYE76_028677 [Lolium multiflorum]|uniref:Transmembrane protein n=1 Tax=Lolium multiflorum TaxID=4521 RepID=A0AAD8QN44_LOLMU|nr:hypothetical protein QYE76_028677 [Lolium multiflorum]